MPSLIPFKEVYFPGDDPENRRKQAALESRVKFWEQKMMSMPSHSWWFDMEAMEDTIINMVLTEMLVADWHKFISPDPFNKVKLISALEKSQTRLHALRSELGLTAQRINQLTPKNTDTNTGVLPTVEVTVKQEA